MISTIRKEKESKRKQSNDRRIKSKITAREKQQEKFEGIKRDEKKRKFREKGLEFAKRQKTL